MFTLAAKEGATFAKCL